MTSVEKLLDQIKRDVLDRDSWQFDRYFNKKYKFNAEKYGYEKTRYDIKALISDIFKEELGSIIVVFEKTSLTVDFALISKNNIEIM